MNNEARAQIADQTAVFIMGGGKIEHIPEDMSADSSLVSIYSPKSLKMNEKEAIAYKRGEI